MRLNQNFVCFYSTTLYYKNWRGRGFRRTTDDTLLIFALVLNAGEWHFDMGHFFIPVHHGGKNMLLHFSHKEPTQQRFCNLLALQPHQKCKISVHFVWGEVHDFKKVTQRHSGAKPAPRLTQ